MKSDPVRKITRCWDCQVEFSFQRHPSRRCVECRKEWKRSNRRKHHQNDKEMAIVYDLYLHVEKRKWSLWTKGQSGSVFHEGNGFSKLQEKMPYYYFNRIMWEFIQKASEVPYVKKESTVRLLWTQSEAGDPHYRFLKQ